MAKVLIVEDEELRPLFTQHRRWYPAITGPVWFRSRSMTTHPAIGEAAGIGADGSCRSAYTLN